MNKKEGNEEGGYLLKFRLTDFMQPECTCKIEKRILEIKGVRSASIDP